MPFNTVEGRNLVFIVTKSHYSGDELHDTAISLAALDTARKSGKKKKKHETCGR